MKSIILVLSLAGAAFGQIGFGTPGGTIPCTANALGGDTRDSAVIAYWALNAPQYGGYAAGDYPWLGPPDTATPPPNWASGGTLVADCGPNGYTGTASGLSSYYNPIQYLTAAGDIGSTYPGGTLVANIPYRVDGTASNYVDIASVALPSSFSVTAWAQWQGDGKILQYVKFDGSAIGYSNTLIPAALNRIIEIGSIGGNGVYLGTSNAATAAILSSGGTPVAIGQGAFQFIVTSSGTYSTCSGGTVDFKTHMITATYSAGTAYLYVDGLQVATCSASSTPATLSARIGAPNSGTTPTALAGRWNGYVSGIRFYNVALSSADAARLYANKVH